MVSVRGVLDRSVRRGTRATSATIAPVVTFAAALVLSAGCDAGKEPYNQAVALEEQGKLVEAAAQYDAVCRRAPDSKLCTPSVARAAEVRLRTADELIRGTKFADAKKLLEVVRDSHDSAGHAKAEATLASPAVLNGLKWEVALQDPDKAAVLADMEAVAASNTPIAPKATEWLTHERPAIFLAQARAACSTDKPECTYRCTRLENLHPGTPEAVEAKTLRDAWQQRADERAEQARRDQEKAQYPLRLQAEKLLQQCAQWHAAQRRQSDCMIAVMARPTFGDEVMAAVSECGDGEAITRRKDKLDEQWKETLAPLDTGELLDSLAKRWEDACDHGEYTAVKIEKPKD